MCAKIGLITEETFLRNIKRYLRRSYASGNAVKLGSDLRARGVVEEVSPNEWLARYSKEKAFKVDDAGKLVPMDDHRGWELFGKIKNKSGEETKIVLIRKLILNCLIINADNKKDITKKCWL